MTGTEWLAVVSPSSSEEGLGWCYNLDVARARAMLRIATTAGPSSKEEGRFVCNIVSRRQRSSAILRMADGENKVGSGHSFNPSP